MSELKFRNKYRIPSNRLKNWDYGSNSAYFITICTKNREHFFGEIQNGKMQLNELGKNAFQFWMEIPNHFPFIELGNFVVMPNHTHGILIIDKPVEMPNFLGVRCPIFFGGGEMPNLGVVDMPNLGVVDMPNLGISTNGDHSQQKNQS